MKINVLKLYIHCVLILACSFLFSPFQACAQKGAELLIRPKLFEASKSTLLPADIIRISKDSIADQLDPVKTLGLSRNAMAPRFNRMLFYLWRAKNAGAEPFSLINDALESVHSSEIIDGCII